jgi:hypothetical protein
MADIRTLNVIEDSGSEELKRLRKSYNALLDNLGTFLDAAEAATIVADINTAATTFLAAIEVDTAEVMKVGGQPGLSNAPARPLV